MERAQEVLAAGVVDRRLASDRRVGHPRGGRRNGVPGDAAQEDGGREPRDVGGDSPADRHDGVVPPHARRERGIGDGLDRGEGLGGLAVGDREVEQWRRRQRRADPLGPGPRGGGADQQEAAGGRREVPARGVEQPRADPDRARRVIFSAADGDPLRLVPGVRRSGRAHAPVFLGGSSPSSASCSGKTRAGAFVIRSIPEVVLGKAITSRREEAPAAIAQMRSRPSAIPP